MIKIFKKFDIIIYSIVFIFMGIVLNAAITTKNSKAENVEIYVNNKLQYTFKLSSEEKILQIPTDIGGVEVIFQDKQVRVSKSFSPRQIAVKQGWISKSGETIIGVPDKLLIKIVGEKDGDIDAVLR